MTYGQQSPFIQTVQPVLPKVFKPLVYCEFRVESGGQGEAEVDLCATFACTEIHEMKFCVSHAAIIEAALATEQGSSG